MIRKIEIRNFMSHPHTVIEPADGLTVIVGENNTGKSALIGALQILCRNAPGDYMVRHGEKECSIRVVTSEGDDIEWIRKGKVVSYRINGKDIHRLGGGVPDELHELLRLPLVETENDPFDIHFGEQKKPIFLLNETPSRRATFFASSSDTIRLIEMQNRHRRKVQDAKAEENELVRREAGLRGRLDRLADIDRLGTLLERLEGDFEEIRAAEISMENLRKAIRSAEAAKIVITKWSETAAAARELDAPPLLEAVDPLQRLIAGITAAESEIAHASSRIAAMKAKMTPPLLSDTRHIGELIGRIAAHEARAEKNESVRKATEALTAVPSFADTAGISLLISRIGAVRGDLSALAIRTRTLTPLAVPPEIPSLENLRRLVTAINSASSHLDAAGCLGTCLEKLPIPPETVDLSGLRSLIGKMAESEAACKESECQFENIRKETAAFEAELRACIAEAGVCPTCGREIDPEHFMECIPLAAEGAV